MSTTGNRTTGGADQDMARTHARSIGQRSRSPRGFHCAYTTALSAVSIMHVGRAPSTYAQPHPLSLAAPPIPSTSRGNVTDDPSRSRQALNEVT